MFLYFSSCVINEPYLIKSRKIGRNTNISKSIYRNKRVGSYDEYVISIISS